jgi:hypothetical protein
MRTLLLISAVALCGSFAAAQNVNVDSIDANQDGTTTIQIKKSKNDEPDKKENKWEVSDGNADVEGEPAATAKEARVTWKKACDDWKKEVRSDNKENKVLALNCGTASCGGDAGSKTCTSKGTYKIKTRID